MNDLGKIIAAIKEFDTYESILHHDQLEIHLPSGFYRYYSVLHEPDKEWGSVDVRLIYYHRELDFSIRLVEKSHTPSFTIAEQRHRDKDCVTEYRVVEDINLSIRDAKRLIIFLQSYFRCFYFNITTKLLR